MKLKPRDLPAHVLAFQSMHAVRCLIVLRNLTASHYQRS
jgi:hypothetical protein